MSRWKRGRPLIALAVAAAAVVGLQFWFQVRPTLENSPPPPIVAEGPVELGGHRLALDSVRWEEFEAPEGSTSLSVRLRADSDTEAESCRSFVLSEIDGDRVWLPAHADLDIDADDERNCRKDSDSYRILTVFLLPDDATGPFWLDVPIGEHRESVRFRVDG